MRRVNPRTRSVQSKFADLQDSDNDKQHEPTTAQNNDTEELYILSILYIGQYINMVKSVLNPIQYHCFLSACYNHFPRGTHGIIIYQLVYTCLVIVHYAFFSRSTRDETKRVSFSASGEAHSPAKGGGVGFAASALASSLRLRRYFTNNDRYTAPEKWVLKKIQENTIHTAAGGFIRREGTEMCD